ncbi:hypothetical protein PV383_19860 [Streptomyces caniscabiei]|uniref:MarR family transcriptional regulator n=1 Tax=Streptomyces caniscabiei TaxID=2746961 RepID=A0ABU4MQJ6_9ACTN|nr:hypothetical protein [Streptomyces caniscabiei]MBE4758356.1 hypothetical protein [Streptomyces caniscabiei]MBE4788447.1 hypothetical protein [Streptomyces caniscabiei]MDX2986539.1 hypothetical protein [Streptomyces caniscabiei]MDX3039416.1 hypothetical protein [Streptomyces caniscabiei]
MTDTEPGSDYVQPADRPTAWAAMATDLTTAGRTTAQIADALCIDEATVLLLTASVPTGRAA